MTFLWLGDFRKNPLLTTLLWIVIGLHGAFLLILLIFPAFSFAKKQHSPLIVTTIVLKPKTSPIFVEKKSSGQIACSEPRPQTSPASKQTSPKSLKTSSIKESTPTQTTQKLAPPTKKDPAIVDKKMEKTTPAPASKNSSPPHRNKISDSLLKELEESIANIETKGDKGTNGKTTLNPKKAIAPLALQIDALPATSSSQTEKSKNYTDVLVSRLHQDLTLPDYGEVKIQLSLREDGTVCKVIVLKAQSEKNKRYLETHLPQLTFPNVWTSGAKNQEYTFILTFCNE